ncbi:MAG: LysR family transcriptional regulator [Gammaproteobacteria bacterium]
MTNTACASQLAKVAEEGSFSAAGRALRLSTSVVSHHVKALKRVMVSLFRRSTRALSLTGSRGAKIAGSCEAHGRGGRGRTRCHRRIIQRGSPLLSR